MPHGFRWSARQHSSIICIVLLLALTLSAPLPIRADGCFVFRWDKKTDINEPTQKAIIVHDAGREDLLLQVKYEGPLEEFGWLIPVPSLPKVEKGSMEAFYELSQLTQRHFGAGQDVVTLSTRGGHEESVEVFEIKTVGAYEVAVLSAQDSASLARWLQTHDYSIPEGKSEIVDEYVRRGWYFIAAKIQLDKGVAFKTVSTTSPKDSDAPTKARKILQSKLSTGELHPLLISFDTPKCVFPLKISAVGGNPSEVSLYVLSSEPLLDRFIFDEALEKLHERWQEWAGTREQMRPQRERVREISMQNIRSLQLAYQMYSLAPPDTNAGKPTRHWTVEDLVTMGKEGQPSVPRESLDDGFSASSHELLQCLQVAFENVPQCVKVMPRLKGKTWYLTKQVRMFRPEEMRDLEFEPAIPVVAQVLPRQEGAVAAGLLSQFGPGAVPVLITASKSTNSTERVNASAGLGWPKDSRFVEPLLNLLKDEVPKVRFNALRGVALNWDSRFIESLISLFRDEHPQIRMQATQWLRLNDPGDRPQVYVDLLKDVDPDVQLCALQVLSRTNGAAIPRAELIRLLGSSRIQTVSLALNLLGEEPASGWLARPSVQSPLAKAREEKLRLSSAETGPLTTNQITMARLMGLKILERNADAQAVELTLPLLRDTNSIVRNRAFALLRAVSGQGISGNDPAKWEQWWATNKGSFVPHRLGP
jgi:HEAT repeat protein